MTSSESPDALTGWLADLDAEALRDLVEGARSRIPSLEDWLDAERG